MRYRSICQCLALLVVLAPSPTRAQPRDSDYQAESRRSGYGTRDREGLSPANEDEEEDANRTEPEKIYYQLKDSESQRERQLGERWLGLIKRRVWTDASGKFRIYAKYLAHDPEFQWVQLLALKGKGEQETEKEVKVPLNKLDKKGQGVVKRIAAARNQIEKILPDLASDQETDDSRLEDRAASPSGEAESREALASEAEAQGLIPPAVAEAMQAPKGEYGSEGGQGQEGSLDSQSEAAMRGMYDTQASSAANPEPVALNPNQPNLPDRASWRTSYDAFVSQLSAKKNADGDWILDWGDLKDLQKLAEAVVAAESLRTGALTKEEAQVFLEQGAGVAERLGEVSWRAHLPTPPLGPGRKLVMQLAELAEPFLIEFRLEQENVGDWSHFDKGVHVQFIGRFETIRGSLQQPVLVMRIRFPDEQPQGAKVAEAAEIKDEK
jgi:hypothetical protein